MTSIAPRIARWFNRAEAGRDSLWPSLRAFTAEERWLLGFLIALGAWIRLHDLGYNSAFNDESINVIVGRDVLAGQLKPSPIPMYVGWYLFPLMAWWADQLGGVVGMRAMTGVLGLGTMWAVSHIARRMFGNREAIAALILVMVLSPFVFAGRVAFREAGTICFMAAGIACFVEAWATNRRRFWAASALFVFAAFLCKHPIGMYGPPMVGLAMLAGANARRWFALFLTALVTTYLVLYRAEMMEMWHVLRTTPILYAPDAEIKNIYGIRRLDVYATFALALIGFALDRKSMLGARLWLLGGGLLFAAIHVTQRADQNTYRHAAYVLIFFIPLAVHAIAQLLARVSAAEIPLPKWALAISASLIAVPLALAGRDWKVTRSDVAFGWVSNTFAAEYLRAWTGGSRLVLVDDQTLRYELWPEFKTWQITDAFYYSYQGQLNGPAYTAAVRDGVFDFIVLDGAAYDASTKMRDAIMPVIWNHYVLANEVADSITGQGVQVYRRAWPAVQPPGQRNARLLIHEPATGSRSSTANVYVSGVLSAPRGGERIQIEVFTNQWWPQGTPVDVDPLSGTFEANVSLGGVGPQRCHHLIRARAYDFRRRLIASTMVVDVARIDPNEPDPNCEHK